MLHVFKVLTVSGFFFLVLGCGLSKKDATDHDPSPATPQPDNSAGQGSSNQESTPSESHKKDIVSDLKEIGSLKIFATGTASVTDVQLPDYSYKISIDIPLSISTWAATTPDLSETDFKENVRFSSPSWQGGVSFDTNYLVCHQPEVSVALRSSGQSSYKISFIGNDDCKKNMYSAKWFSISSFNVMSDSDRKIGSVYLYVTAK